MEHIAEILVTGWPLSRGLAAVLAWLKRRRKKPGTAPVTTFTMCVLVRCGTRLNLRSSHPPILATG
jgi:hypothetical protein